ncbi:hypothetical protein ACTL6U_17240 [Rhodovibrionaceae bacterium A322]
MEFFVHTLTSLWGYLAVFFGVTGLILLIWLRPSRLLGGFVILLAGVLLIPAGLSAQKLLDCKEDLHCWGRKNLVPASFACEEYSNIHVPYRPKWVRNWGAKYKMFDWYDQEKGLLKLTSTRYRIAGQAGVYRYECHYDPFAGKVLEGLTVQGEDMDGE